MMDNVFMGYGAFGLAINGVDHAKMSEADKEKVIMLCKDANSTDEIDQILSRVGDDDSWGEIAEIVDRIR